VRCQERGKNQCAKTKGLGRRAVGGNVQHGRPVVGRRRADTVPQTAEGVMSLK
jgi:hypothetical protein